MPKEPGAINGGMLQRKNPINSPVITINVNNIGESCKKVKDVGGKIIMKKFKVGDMGYAAYFKDTEGNLLGLWQNLR